MKIAKGWAFPDADDFMAQQLADDGTYQYHHLQAALAFVKKWDCAIDGGAHVGTWSLPMSLKFKRVLSFEPSPDTFECLSKNLKELHPAPNAELFDVALGSASGWVTMTLDGFERAIEIKNTGARFTIEGGQTRRIRIDGLQLQELDFLKLDIEGGEPDALKGARETLLRCKPVVLFEDKHHWSRYGYARRAPHEFLASLGAVHLAREQMDEIWGWV